MEGIILFSFSNVVDANERTNDALLEARETDRTGTTAHILEEDPLRIQRYLSYSVENDVVKHFCTLRSLLLKQPKSKSTIPLFPLY